MPKVQTPRRLPSGKWAIRVIGDDGTRRMRTFESHDDALAALGDHRVAVSRVKAGIAPLGSSLTVAEAYKKWIRRRAGRAKDDATYHFETHILPALGEEP